MPYIKEEDRDRISEGSSGATTPGELNFILTSTCIKYLLNHGESYKTYNDIVGALECCKLEIFRRRIADYENKKIKDNGDVYPV